MEKKIILKMYGGLGNQLFQFSMGYSLAKNRNEKIFLDISSYKKDLLRNFLLNQFNFDFEILSAHHRKNMLIKNIFSSLLNIPKFRTVFLDENKTFINMSDSKYSLYLDGYWQNPKYFEKYQTDLISQIVPKKKLSAKAEKILKQITQDESVAVHIRRGDYAKNPKTKQVHGILPLDYYQKAVNYISRKKHNCHFFIFSDDDVWVKNEFSFIKSKTFVSKTINDEVEELFLMSRCKHNIIANSTFSWWGAWLNQNSNKIIISPKKWFADPKMNHEQVLSKIGKEL